MHLELWSSDLHTPPPGSNKTDREKGTGTEKVPMIKEPRFLGLPD